MGRRTVLLIVAALVAALGATLVLVYVRGVDARANERFDTVQLLEAVEVIPAGETLEAAQAAGKIQMGSFARGSVLSGAVAETSVLADKVALTTIFPGEQLIADKFGSPGNQESLTIPDGKLAISVNLTDPARVAGFVNPGAEVAVFMSGTEQGDPQDAAGAGEFTRLLLDRVTVIGVGTTTVVPTTTTDTTGQETTEQLPSTLLTLALDQAQAERVLFAAGTGELAFALLSEKSKIAPDAAVTSKNLFE